MSLTFQVKNILWFPTESIRSFNEMKKEDFTLLIIISAFSVTHNFHPKAFNS